jgi:hypothetical protein
VVEKYRDLHFVRYSAVIINNCCGDCGVLKEKKGQKKENE